MKCFSITVTVALAIGQVVFAQYHPEKPATYPLLPTLREQAAILDGWTAERVEHIPVLMAKYRVDACIATRFLLLRSFTISEREYAEDTVFFSFKPATTFAARRRTVYLFHNGSSEALSGKPNPLVWIDNTPQVWSDLRGILELYGPSTIAINIDPDIAFADGMHAGELERVSQELGEKWMGRVVRRPMLAVEYMARRIPGQLEYYKKLQEMGWAMISEAFSEKTITPGLTTTEDVEWWFRDQQQVYNVTTWFQPSVSIFRPSSRPSSNIIEEGDVLHVDFGITFLGLNTDTQHLGYVLRTSQGEKDVPEGLKAGLRSSNRMQEIVRAQMQPGQSGNQVLLHCLSKMQSEGIIGQVYSHPIGDRGHAPGSLIGMTNLPFNVPVLGDLPILPQTYYSIELFATQFIPEWNETINFPQEEDVYWSDVTQGWEWVWGRQERFHVVRRPSNASVRLRVQ
ncbi:xaa-Pro aminopeptidase family enzyme [Ramaria rubella]|nr:xaa-Pro aminopeptidase family enzyme [Ramaria rubella]